MQATTSESMLSDNLIKYLQHEFHRVKKKENTFLVRQQHYFMVTVSVFLFPSPLAHYLYISYLHMFL